MNKHSGIRWDLIFGLASIISLAILIVMLYNDFGKHFLNNSDTEEGVASEEVETQSEDDEDTEEDTQRPKSTSNVVICLDAGHGGTDNGTIVNNYKEKDLCLEISKLVKQELEKYDIKVVMTRTDDSSVSDDERVRICNSSNAEAVVSIKMNSFSGNGEASGSEAWVHSSEPDKSVSLSTLILQKLNTQAGLKNRGHKAGIQGNNKDNYYLNAHSKCTSCILNVGFMTSSSDLNALTTDKEKTAKAIADGIIDYLIQVGKY